MVYLITTIGLLNILLGAYVLLKNPRQKGNRLFSVMAFMIGIWVLSNTILFTDRRFEYPWIYLSYALAVLIPPLLLHWVIDFTKYKLDRLYLFAVYIISFIFFILSLIPGLVLKDVYIAGVTSFRFPVAPAKLFSLYSLFLSFTFFISLFILFRTRNNSVGLKRVQFNHVLFACGIPIVLAIILDIIFPLFWGFSLYNIDSLTPFIFIVLLTHSITRYRFLEIKVVLRKSVVYLISLVIVLSLYSYFALVLKSTIEKYWNINSNWATFTLIVLVALGFPPLKTLVERLINKFFKGKQSIDLAVKEVRQKIAKKTGLEALINLISKEIRKYLELEEVRFYLIDHKEQKLVFISSKEPREAIELDNPLVHYFEKHLEVLITDEIPYLVEKEKGQFEKEILQQLEKELRRQKASLVLPLKTEGEVFGLILLGEGSKAYTVQEVQFLEKLRETVTLALANAILYQEAMARVEMMKNGQFENN